MQPSQYRTFPRRALLWPAAGDVEIALRMLLAMEGIECRPR
jgi:hypothetical protein